MADVSHAAGVSGRLAQCGQDGVQGGEQDLAWRRVQGGGLLLQDAVS